MTIFILFFLTVVVGIPALITGMMYLDARRNPARWN